MEGTPFITSAAYRIRNAKRLPLPYSVRYTPASTPTGMPSSPARPTTFAEPTMALAMPPPLSPTGFGRFVRKERLRDEARFLVLLLWFVFWLLVVFVVFL